MTNVPDNDENDTNPELAAADTEPMPPVIPAGDAQTALADALHGLSLAQRRVEAIAMACARALDANAAEAP
jgi:hypothetical protein